MTTPDDELRDDWPPSAVACAQGLANERDQLRTKLTEAEALIETLSEALHWGPETEKALEALAEWRKGKG